MEISDRRDEYTIVHVLNNGFTFAAFHKPCQCGMPFIMREVEISYIDEVIAEHNEKCDKH